MVHTIFLQYLLESLSTPENFLFRSGQSISLVSEYKMIIISLCQAPSEVFVKAPCRCSLHKVCVSTVSCHH